MEVIPAAILRTREGRIASSFAEGMRHPQVDGGELMVAQAHSGQQQVVLCLTCVHEMTY